MNTKYYLAYGSNLSVQQMAERCPRAVYVGKAMIPNYELMFKGSQSGSYLTIEAREGASVPVLVWQITDYDERCLDRYEGYPSFYYKRNLTVEVEPLLSMGSMVELDALVYIMHEDRSLGCPTLEYYATCIDGYEHFGFDAKFLQKALARSIGTRDANQLLREVGFNEY